MKSKTKVILPVIIVIAISLVVLIYLYNSGTLKSLSPESSANHVIVLGEDGFKPDTITIKKGDSITFKTTGKKFFWPASDIHPTHLIYPEFDPKDPIPANKTWTFKFEKVGTWKFHDHLSPYYTGTITVDK